MTFRFIYGLILLALVGLNQPASAASSGSAVKSPKTQTQPKTPADAQIERTIKDKLAKSKLRADHFTVSVVKGVATIEGSTNVMQHKGVMTRMAKLAGATAVHNNIRISDAAKAKAVATLAKGRQAPAVPRAAASASTGNTARPAAPPPIPHAMVLPPAGSR